MLDHDESNLHALHLDLAGSGLLDNDEIIIADIRDRPRLAQIFATTKPEIVFHAAAHKHLPLLERHPCEGVKTNVLGTQHLVDLAVEHGTSRFILISTDKAADPTSVLGATKRLAEFVVRRASGGATAMASVRFGNVLGSRGSLLTVLADQMARERAITVTHPEVTRFFMTVEEAVGLVLEAVTMAGCAETFVLDMGEPVPILELVHKYAAAVNVANVEIQFTGLRPGEKLNEKVFSDSEERRPTSHPKIWSTEGKELGPDFAPLLDQLYAYAAVNDVEGTLKLLRSLVPEYEPTTHEVNPAAARAPYPDGF
jgi:FlaA1/EpsC-like NDP-sugar epimerase